MKLKFKVVLHQVNLLSKNWVLVCVNPHLFSSITNEVPSKNI